jgi:pimeloyl-ACP methyl ester carboxylesterase
MLRRPRAVLLVTLVAGLLASGQAAVAAEPGNASNDGRRTFTGTIDGADYRVELPESWNGTLVLYSHGYHPPGFPTFGIELTNRPPDRSETEAWLLDHGYALAASQFQDGGFGYQVENAQRDQIALLDWFYANIGRPRRTVSAGQSMGAAIAVLLAERHPHRFDGVSSICAGYDPNGTFNTGLDVLFAVKTLLAPGAGHRTGQGDRPRTQQPGARPGDRAGTDDPAGAGPARARGRVQQRRRLVVLTRAEADRSRRADPPPGTVDPERVHPRVRPAGAARPRAAGRRQPVLEHRDRLPPPARPIRPA